MSDNAFFMICVLSKCFNVHLSMYNNNNRNVCFIMTYKCLTRFFFILTVKRISLMLNGASKKQIKEIFVKRKYYYDKMDFAFKYLLLLLLW